MSDYYLKSLRRDSACVPNLQLPTRNRLYLPLIEERRRLVFPFTDLPLELRIMVYVLVFDFSSIERYFDTYTGLFLASGAPRSLMPPRCRKVCPSILLANKEISQEARPFLYITRLLFSHGIIKANLTDVISESLLRNITHITITDAGHNLLDPNLMITFHGVQLLIQQLAHIWQNGHNLKYFKFVVKADDFNWHIRNCVDNVARCGITDFMVAFKRSMGTIRGIDNVVIEGDMDDAWKLDTITRMQLKPQSIFRLPLRVRQNIYRYAANPNEGSRALDQFMRNLAHEGYPPYPTLSTPTILLLNRQVYNEVRALICGTALVINGTVEAHRNPLTIFKFIGHAIFQNIHHLQLIFQQWQYIYLIPDLATALTQSHSLASFHLHFNDALSRRNEYEHHHYPDHNLAILLYPLSQVRGISSVAITGSLPDCYARPLALSMERPHGSSGFPLYASFRDGTLVSLDDLRGSESFPIEIEE